MKCVLLLTINHLKMPTDLNLGNLRRFFTAQLNGLLCRCSSEIDRYPLSLHRSRQFDNLLFFSDGAFKASAIRLFICDDLTRLKKTCLTHH